MKIVDILIKLGWKKDTRKQYYTTLTTYKHPLKKFEFLVQPKEFWVNGKLFAKFALSRTQDEVLFDEVHNLLVIGGDFAINVG